MTILHSKSMGEHIYLTSATSSGICLKFLPLCSSVLVLKIADP